MGLEEGKESTFMAETSSGAISKNQTRESLKAKPKIVKKAVVNYATSTSDTKDTPPVQGRKKVVKKKKIVVVKKGKNIKKEDVKNANSGNMENKNVPEDLGNKSVPECDEINDMNVTADAWNLNGKKLKEEENTSFLSEEKGKNNHKKLENKSVPEGEKVNDMDDTAVAQSLTGENLKEGENKNFLSAEQGKNSPENLENKSVLEGEKVNDKNDTSDAQSLNGEKLKEGQNKNVLSEEQGKNNHENLENKSVPEGKKINDMNDKEDAQNLKNNPGNLKRKKKIIVVRKKIKKCKKEGSKTPNEESESVISAEKSKKKPGIEEGSKAPNKGKSKSVITADKREKRPDIGKEKKLMLENNTENSDMSRNNRLKQNVEDRNGSSRKQNNQTNKEKLSGSVRKEQRNKKIGGLILFCNTKTKLDCFRYHIMGVSSSRKDLVLDIKPGLKLFLYDFDIKLLYGIYSASSSGGTKLEPAAFNGSFPFQVRFEIYKDCYPLPESAFKRAIKENYGSNNKFDQELTSQQVNKLMELFKPTEVKQHALPLYPPQSTSIDKGDAKESEAEYLAHHRREPLARESNTYDDSRRYGSLLNKNAEVAYRPAPSDQREPSPGKLFLSEKDYRTYGLRRERRNISPPRSHIAPTLGFDSKSQENLPVLSNRDAGKEYHTPYSHSSLSASTASIVDSYLKVPYYGLFKDPYQNPPRIEREEIALGSYSLGKRETAYQPESSYLLRRENHPSQRETTYRPESSYLSRRENHPSQRDYTVEVSEGRRRERDEASALYSSYGSKAHSEHNQVQVNERAKPETSSFAPVSARYSFAGPSSRYL